MKWLVILLLGVWPAQAAEKALILNDMEQQALKASLDAAIRANGLSALSRNAFILNDKLDAAGTITEQKSAEPKKDDGK